MNETEDLTGEARIVKNVVFSWISYLVFFLSGFLLPRIIDDNLGRSLLGVWDFGWSVVGYLSLTEVGVGTALTRYVARFRAIHDRDSLQKAVSTVVVLQFLQSLVTLLAVIAIVALFPSWFGNQFGTDLETAQMVVFILGLSLAIQFGFDASRGVLTGSHRWDLFNGLKATSYLIAVSLMIASLLFGGGLVGLSIIYASMTLAQGLVRLYIARRVCPDASFRLGLVSWNFSKEILVFGGKWFLVGMTPLLIIQSAYILTTATLGPAALAILARHYAIVKHIGSFITRFTYVLTPMAGSMQSMENQDSLLRLTTSATMFSFALTIPVLMMFLYFGNPLMAFWMGDDYVSPNLVIILAIGSMLSIGQSPLLRILVGLNLHGGAALISVAIAVLCLSAGIGVGQSISWGLEEIAFLLVATLTLIQGISIPIYACAKLKIRPTQYMRSVFLKPFLICVIGIAFLQLTQLALKLGPLIEASLFAVYVSIAYWRFLLKADHKRRVLELIPGFDQRKFPST